ncbi:cellulose binding domain-containing protein [Streptomonospora wellingtoniae]|uniref:Cellulose binding domain-containing protein n=1 Tax=Streptomonospora wellingtoniae TaxID=3075544 RepID=A0ABU2KTK7_9ACTN|nr:cellulose binding domain-containing protein [Streptomonospora sp. DSM 45055]MDT0302473.1 cellulose binding domain-containing protein [Streptomonospora sp. DSM 45055]
MHVEHTRSGRPRAGAVRGPAVAALGALTAASAIALPPPAASEPGPESAAPVEVRVNAHLGRGTLDQAAFGANAAIWDSHMNDPEVASLMDDAGIGVMRYPGGSYSDIYHWEDHTAPGGYVAPGTGFDAFMETVQDAGAQPMITANYGTGSPEEAAAWVRYANVTRDYGVKYWEIGNEIYGNGHYGNGWEEDDHADKSPAEYARNVRAYAEAMKDADPSVRIGAVLTTPGDWPDGVIGPGDAADWNNTVLSRVADTVDFVIVHSYPGGATADEALDRVSRLPGQLRQVRRQLDHHAGDRSDEIRIALTEVNSGVQMNSRPNGLFAADAFMTALENGVFNIDWWNIHNGPDEVSQVDGETDFNDYGLLSSGGCVEDVCQPPVNTPFHPYYGLKSLTHLGAPGDTMVASSSSSEDVSAHAVHQADGDMSVMLINKDQDNAHPVEIDYAGFTPDGREPVVHRYARGDDDVTPVSDPGEGTRTLPPYSITTVSVSPKSGEASVGAPGAPEELSADSTSATLSWPAGDGEPVRYEVYEHLGANAELLGTSTSTSMTLRNLPPGTEHTVNVLARDEQGRLSRPSEPVTLSTTSPNDADCRVTYRVDSGWGNGFVATVTVSNLADTPINGWSLDFTWPESGQSVQSAWSAEVSGDGRRVHVTDNGDNAELAPGGGSTATFGFVGANEGANPAPKVFTLNGGVCHTVRG